MDTIIRRLAMQRTKPTAKQLQEIAHYVASVPFVRSILQVDEPLWGGFWQGDVISPGYSLPAVELALLRAIRLDGIWPESAGVEQFLADLRQAIQHSRAGVWALMTAGEPCLVFAAPTVTDHKAPNVQCQSLVTVAWYCATTRQLHAGYRADGARLQVGGAIELRPLTILRQPALPEVGEPNWIVQAINQHRTEEKKDLAARLDMAILRKRLQVVTD
jgi:hypothetical protein